MNLESSLVVFLLSRVLKTKRFRAGVELAPPPGTGVFITPNIYRERQKPGTPLFFCPLGRRKNTGFISNTIYDECVGAQHADARVERNARDGRASLELCARSSLPKEEKRDKRQQSKKQDLVERDQGLLNLPS